ncbi:hypothetical protein GCM10011358_30570 [Sinisalibacter lacisalsi]|uniref:Uncharacterized protein n=1 Tax=Sinisalibacter lacisalsi TaxID=1526570 RepID=A0ABQ1QUN7_9RHOB|nr:hypothetical protein GCM10011358_30570 [Sinisalibacter lacisalsi]
MSDIAAPTTNLRKPNRSFPGPLQGEATKYPGTGAGKSDRPASLRGGTRRGAPGPWPGFVPALSQLIFRTWFSLRPDMPPDMAPDASLPRRTHGATLVPGTGGLLTDLHHLRVQSGAKVMQHVATRRGGKPHGRPPPKGRPPCCTTMVYL